MGRDELLEKLKRDYPELGFREGKRFAFRMSRGGMGSDAQAASGAEMVGWQGIALPGRGTVYYEKTGKYGEDEDKYWKMQILHEVGHGLLGHRDWGVDLERVKMESMAWAKARELCEKYGVEYEEEFAEAEMDTYREWLHQRSRCGGCGLTRYQTRDGRYHCPRCEEFGAG